MVESAPLPLQHTRLRVLDGLRLCAALSVVLFHYTSANNLSWGRPVAEVFPALQDITVYGAAGVELFFMISGFVVLMSAWGRSIPQFVGSRVSRLYPAYWVSVILASAVLFLTRIPIAGSDWSQIGVKGFLANLTMLQTGLGIPNVDGVYWTLWVELKFYVLLGLFLLVGITRTRILVLCLAWPLAGALALAYGDPLLIFILNPQYAPFFAMGMLVYLLHRDGISWLPLVLIAANWAYSIAVLSGVYAEGLLPAAGGAVHTPAVMLVFTVSLAALVVATLTPVARISWGWLTIAGLLTYPVYLLHDVVGSWLIILAPDDWPPVVTLVGVVLVVCAASYVLHRLVEKPLAPVLRRSVQAALEWRPRRKRPESGAEGSGV